tara:strand:+ start:785 stop:1096 length:312 start_codon:yes stop_codon:yes gene_type:complete
MSNLEKLKLIRNNIEKMTKVHHIKFFEILKKNNIPFSENRNGIFFNMNLFTEEIIADINNYINYVEKQESNLKQTEKLKSDFKNEYFKDNKEKTESNVYQNVG